MQIEVYNMLPEDSRLTITLEAICDTFSSLLWDVEYYQCGCFEVYSSGRMLERENQTADKLLKPYGVDL